MSNQPQIVGSQLTSVRVSRCGYVVELGFKDGSGYPMILALPHRALGMLLMTLPRLIEMSLRQRMGDASLRQVYPVGDWRLEAATDNQSLLLTLATPDGFAVSFCLPFDDARNLGQALATQMRAPQSDMPVRH
jgi:hypothetical protein